MKKIVILVVIFLSQIAFAQDFELVNHQVQLGETVKMISKRYKVEPSEIYRLNKFAIDGVRQGMVLKLLVPKKEEPIVEVVEEYSETPSQSVVVGQANEVPAPQPGLASGESVEHTVAPKETLYSLSRLYNVPVDEIKRQNEKLLKRGLQIGQVLTIRRD